MRPFSNLLTNAQVAERMSARGLCLDVAETVRLRRAAYGGVHFRETISVYHRRCAVQHAPCCSWHGAQGWVVSAVMSTLEDLGLQPWQKLKPNRQRGRRLARLLVLLLPLLLPCCALVVVCCHRARGRRRERVQLGTEALGLLEGGA